MTRVCRWGILGTANIARKNWKAMRLSGNGTLVAVASRERSRAEQFIAECQGEVPFPTPPAACGSYEELLARADVDAVYIPLPTGIRPQWVIRAAEAGKHVLCEKPCAPDAGQLRQMLDACRRRNVQFMDGVMFMHSQRLPLLRRVLDDPNAVGRLRRITSQFCFAGSSDFLRDNIRVQHELEPLGTLGDLGWYNIRLSLWVMNYTLPRAVSGRMLAARGEVPIEFSGELFFDGDVTASFYCSFQTMLQQWAYISGDRGTISLDDFVLPHYGCEVGFILAQPYYRTVGCAFNMEQHLQRYSVREYSDGMPGAQEINMIRTFSQGVLQGKWDPQWAEIAWKTQVVLDACLRSARQGGAVLPVEP